MWSRVAQWKRAGPITQRSEDRNLALLYFFLHVISMLFFYRYVPWVDHERLGLTSTSLSYCCIVTVWLISTIMKHTLYVMSTPILAPKDAHVILSKVTANSILIHNVFYHQTSCPLFILFSKLHKKGLILK